MGEGEARDHDSYFNSIKVRLNLDLDPQACASFLLFQFHKGTIKPLGEDDELTDVQDFNSIKVRLNHKCGIARAVGGIFQFHKGTIKPIWSILSCI